MYLRIIDEVINYPYSIPQLREALPNVSLPAELSDETLMEWDMYVVTPTPIPNDYTDWKINGLLLEKLEMNYWQNVIGHN